MSRSIKWNRCAIPHLIAFAAISASLLSCGTEEIVNPPPAPAQVASIEVTIQSDTLTALGATTQCTARVLDATGSAMTGKTVSWSVNDTSIAAVSASGLATAIANGQTTISAESDGVRGQASIVVRQEVVGISVAPDVDTLTALGEQLQLVASALDSRGNAVAGVEIHWSTEDTAVVALTDSGHVTALANGTATVEAEVDGFEADAELVVDQEVAAVVVDPSLDSLLVLGAQLQLSASAEDSAGNEVAGVAFTWSTLDTLVIGLSDSGLVTARANGAAEISAEAEGVEGRADVVVWQVVDDLSMSMAVDTLVSLGEDVQVDIEAWDSGGSVVVDPVVEWGTTDSTVIVVSASGLVTSVGNGVANVVATSGTASAQDTLVVNQIAVRIGVTPSADTIVQTGWVDLTATFYDANDYSMEPEPVTWHSSNETSATVDADGRVGGLVPGISEVTASWDLLVGESQITVAVPTVALYPEMPSLFENDTIWLDGAVMAPNGDRVNSGPLTWNSANTGVATVSDAVVQGVAPGLAQVSVGLAGVWDAVEVAVLEQPSGSDREVGYVRTIYPTGEPSTQEFRTVSLDGSNNRRVSPENEYVSNFAFSTSGDRVAVNYVQVNGVGRAGTYVSDPDGTNEVEIGLYAWTPHWSPEDDWITYRDYIGSGESDVYIMAPDGSNQTRLTVEAGDELEPRWSPDGRRILFLHPSPVTDESAIWVMNTDGSNRQYLNTPTPAYRVRWSPDGKFIAYDNGRGIWIVDGFGNVRPLTENCDVSGECTGPTYVRPDWAPDAARLTYRRDIGVYVVNVDGTDRTRIVQTEEGSGTISVWSPSGSFIAFTARHNGWPAIGVIRPDGSDLTFITGEENAGLPGWR